MEKVRKILEWVWYNKERMVLAVMVAILCWHVYKVVYPPKEEPQVEHRLPSGAVPDRPLSDVLPPPARQSTSWDLVYTPNPFWYLSAQKETGKTSEGPTDAGISLLRIRKVGGDKYKAQLRTANTTRWYEQGEAFESFELLRIDPEAGTCEVRSERLGRVIKLEAP